MTGDHPWKLTLVGDMILQDGETEGAVGEEIYSLFSRSDLLIGNLEGPVTERGIPADKAIAFRMPPESLRVLQHLGFDALTRANNHALDYGIDGLKDTTKLLDQAGVPHCGAGLNLEEATRPCFLDGRGVRVGLLSYCSAIPSGYSATHERPGVAPIRIQQAYHIDGVQTEEQPGMVPYVFTWAVEADVERALEVVRATRAQCDLLIVALHWGVPPMWTASFQGRIAQYQQPLAHKLIDAGVDIIVGHHPHTVQGIEVYRGGLILYSVGNFIYHPHPVEYRNECRRPSPASALTIRRPDELWQSAVFCLSLYGVKLTELQLVPVALDRKGTPQLASDYERAVVLERIRTASEEVTGEAPPLGPDGRLSLE